MKFRYRAKSNEGAMVEGVVEGASQIAAVEALRTKGLFPVSVEGRGGAGASSGESRGLLDALRTIGTVPLREKVIFFRQLSTMIRAGVTMGSSLSILVEQTKSPRLADSIRRVKASVEAGMPLSAAMRLRSEFSTLMVSMVAAGEEGGKLTESLERLAVFLERQDELRRKIVSAVTYPAVIILFAFFILYLLITVVMPRFSTVFKGMGIPLPKVTLFVFDLSEWVAEFWYIPLLAVAGLIGVLVLMNRNPDTKPILDRAKLRLPLVGDIFYKSIMARSNRTLASLMDAGVPILKSLEMTAQVTDNAPVSDAYLKLRDAARKGASLGDTARTISLFPVMIAHMMSVGEETGQLASMLDKVAGWFELELDEKVKRLTSILEPLLIVVVGGIVAVVALAIFTPIVTAIQAMM